MLKTGIYVDAENVRLCGGYGMRYDVLASLGKLGHSVLLRANSYVVEDELRVQEDREYRQKVQNYFSILRGCGFKLVKKRIRRFQDADGAITTKANADMDLAIDALLQSRNLDRIILVSGDGDFVRLVIALQNQGCRVEVVGFNNVSNELREAADLYISGFLVPGLLPIPGAPDEEWFRGTPLNYNPERGFGFFRYHRIVPEGLAGDTVFFHTSQASGCDPRLFTNPAAIFEFRIRENPNNQNRPEAQEIRLCCREDGSRPGSNREPLEEGPPTQGQGRQQVAGPSRPRNIDNID